MTFILQYVFCRLQVDCCFTLHNLKIRVSSFPHWQASGVSYPFPQPLPPPLPFLPLEFSYNWVQLERNIALKELCKTFSFLPPPFYSTSPLIIDKTQSIISLTASLKSSSSCIALIIAVYLFPGCAGS